MLASLALLFAAQPAPPPLERIAPNVIVEEAPDDAWRAVDPENLLVMELEGGRRIAIELNPDFAPVHVENIRRLARAGWWYDASVYRVQDNYVAQWGVREEGRDLPEGVIENPPEEYVRSVDGLRVYGLGSPDPYSGIAGFSDGWPVALYRDGTASLTHCYGTVGVGRGMAPSTGSGSELYAVIGHAPRHLDRNIAIVGRVIEGIEHFAALPRGSETLGMYPEGSEAAGIERVYLASMIGEEEGRPAFEVMREDSEAFARYLRVRSNRNDDFYRVPAGGVALCNVQVPVRPVAAD